MSIPSHLDDNYLNRTNSTGIQAKIHLTLADTNRCLGDSTRMGCKRPHIANMVNTVVSYLSHLVSFGAVAIAAAIAVVVVMGIVVEQNVGFHAVALDWSRMMDSDCLTLTMDFDCSNRTMDSDCHHRIVDFDFRCRMMDSDCSNRTMDFDCLDRTMDSDWHYRAVDFDCHHRIVVDCL